MVNTKILLEERKTHVHELAESLSKKITRDNGKSNFLVLIKEINSKTNFIEYLSNGFKTNKLISTKNSTAAYVLVKIGDVYFKATVDGFKKSDENLVAAIVLLGRALSIPTVDIILENINNGILIPVPSFIYQKKHPLNQILQNHKL